MSNLTANEVNGLMEAYTAVYDPELREELEEEKELEKEIFETVAYALISQGYTAVDVLEYFATVDEEVIIEDIVALYEGTLIIEEVVSEEYIEEQLKQLNEGLPAIAAGLGLAGRALFGAGARRAAGTVVKRMAGPGVRKAVGGAVQAAKGALNKVSGGKLAGALKTGAKWALGGAAFEGGMRAARGLMGDKDSSAKTTPTADKSKWNASKALGGKAAFSAGGGAAKMKQNPGMSAADVQKQGMINLRNKPATPSSPAPAAPSTPSGGGGGGSSPSTSPKSKVAPAKPDAGPQLTPMQQWAKKHQGLASKVKLGQSGYDEISQMRTKPGPNEKQDQTPTQGPPDAKIDTKAVDADIKAQQERDKNKAKAQTVNASYEYEDAFDLVLEYLLSQGHTDTVDEALYVMMEMDSETIQSICETAADPNRSGSGSLKSNTMDLLNRSNPNRSGSGGLKSNTMDLLNRRKPQDPNAPKKSPFKLL